MDDSNRKDIQIVPVNIHYFQPECGIKVKLLEFKSVPVEITKILTNLL